jgi:hypothetical protein
LLLHHHLRLFSLWPCLGAGECQKISTWSKQSLLPTIDDEFVSKAFCLCAWNSGVLLFVNQRGGFGLWCLCSTNSLREWTMVTSSFMGLWGASCFVILSCIWNLQFCLSVPFLLFSVNGKRELMDSLFLASGTAMYVKPPRQDEFFLNLLFSHTHVQT